MWKLAPWNTPTSIRKLVTRVSSVALMWPWPRLFPEILLRNSVSGKSICGKILGLMVHVQCFCSVDSTRGQSQSLESLGWKLEQLPWGAPSGSWPCLWRSGMLIALENQSSFRCCHAGRKREYSFYLLTRKNMHFTYYWNNRQSLILHLETRWEGYSFFPP